MTAEEALAALKSGDPIHVSGEEMRRFIAAVAPVTRRCKCHITDFGPCDDWCRRSLTWLECRRTPTVKDSSQILK